MSLGPIPALLLAVGLALAGPIGQEPPGPVPVRFLPEVVQADHSSPAVSPDGREIYWAQHPFGEAPRKIYVSRFEDGAWSAPEVAPFTADEDGDCPVISPDGATLIFNSNRPLPSGEPRRRERLWLVTRENGGWTEPRPLDETINGAHLHWQASIDGEGTLYFGSEREGSLGRDDIFAARRTDAGYAEPAALPAPVNTPSHESMPFIDPDGAYLLFIRAHHGAGTPSYPLGFLVSFRDEDGSWTEPAPVSFEGGPEPDVACPFVTRDGAIFFYLALKAVYWVDRDAILELRGR